MRALIFGSLLLVGPTAVAGCPATVGAIREEVDATDTALLRLDGERFLGAMSTLSGSIACAATPLPPRLVGRIHRAKAVLAFTYDDDEHTRLSLLAAHAVTPGQTFAPGALPEGHPLVVQLQQIQDVPAHSRLPRPDAGELWFDGAPTRDRPTARATLVQLTDERGGVVFSDYLLPGDPLPAYPVATSPRRTLRVTSVAAGAGAVALYGGAALARHRFMTYDPGIDVDTLDRRRAQTNLLVTGSGVAALTALVTGGLSIRGVF